MYKIYINKVLLQFRNSDGISEIEQNDPSVLVARYPGKAKFLFNYLDLAEKSNLYQKIILHHDDRKLLKKDLKTICQVIPAAGGLVINSSGHGLCIFRRGHWDLPKGKLDIGEKKKEAAVREVMEETGINSVNIINKLGVTNHLFKNRLKSRVIKRTHWYLMQSDDIHLTPQTEEDIEHLGWYDLDEFIKGEVKIYKSIEDLLFKFIHKRNKGKNKN